MVYSSFCSVAFAFWHSLKMVSPCTPSLSVAVYVVKAVTEDSRSWACTPSDFAPLYTKKKSALPFRDLNIKLLHSIQTQTAHRTAAVDGDLSSLAIDAVQRSRSWLLQQPHRCVSKGQKAVFIEGLSRMGTPKEKVSQIIFVQGLVRDKVVQPGIDQHEEYAPVRDLLRKCSKLI